MNIEDLKQEWRGQRSKEELVIKLFRESRLQKIDSEYRKATSYSVIFMIVNILVNIYTWVVLVQNFSNTSVKIAGISMLIMTYIIFFKNVKSLSIISKINDSKPVIEVQKLIGNLKLQRVKHNRFLFIFSNLFFWSLIILVFKWDLELIIPAVWKEAATVVIIHIVFAVVWFPLSIWILNKCDSTTETSKFWKRLKTNSFLTDKTVNASLNNVLIYIKEIETFENED